LILHALPEPHQILVTHRAFYLDVPDIEIEIAATSPLGALRGERSISTVVRVDSGATTTMLHDGYARHLGIDLSQVTREPVVGITGEQEWYPIALLDMRLCDQWLEVPVLFAPNRWPQLLGREGVFDHLFVAFAYEGLGISPFVGMGVA